MSRVQFITTPKGETLAVLPVEEYEALTADLGEIDETEEEALAAEMRRLREEDRGEALGIAEFRRILDGENPIRIWREYRGLSARELAGLLGCSAGYLSDLEQGKKVGSVDMLRAIARALKTTVDELARPAG